MEICPTNIGAEGCVSYKVNWTLAARHPPAATKSDVAKSYRITKVAIVNFKISRDLSKKGVRREFARPTANFEFSIFSIPFIRLLFSNLNLERIYLVRK